MAAVAVRDRVVEERRLGREIPAGRRPEHDIVAVDGDARCGTARGHGLERRRVAVDVDVVREQVAARNVGRCPACREAVSDRDRCVVDRIDPDRDGRAPRQRHAVADANLNRSAPW